MGCCPAQMGNTVAEAVLRIGLQTVLCTFTQKSEAEAIENMLLSELPMEQTGVL